MEINPKAVLKFFPEDFFEPLEYIEGKALLRMDFEKGVKIAIFDMTLKEGNTLEDIEMPGVFTVLSVLGRKGNTYTCLVQAKYNKNILKISELQPLKVLMAENVIFGFPFIVSKEKIVFTVITDNAYLKTVLKVLKSVGFIKKMSFHKPSFSEYNILSCLTERQKEIIIAAEKHGYYEVPREITSEELSRKLGISKATTVEHLRKAEKRIISEIVAGY
jgi:predicted DNA binding protein